MGSLSSQMWVERQKTVSRWEMNRSNAGSVRGLLKEQLLHSESTTPCSTPTSSAASISSFASTMADLAQVRHGCHEDMMEQTVSSSKSRMRPRSSRITRQLSTWTCPSMIGLRWRKSSFLKVVL